MASGRFYEDIQGSLIRADSCEAYCLRKQAMMTHAQVKLHNCVEKGCHKCIRFRYIDNPGRNILNERYCGDEYRKKVLGCR